MQQQLSQLHSISHESLIPKLPGFDAMKPSQSQTFTRSDQYNSVNQNQGQVVTESRTSYSIEQSSVTSELPNLVENSVPPVPMYEFPHNPPPYHSCYSNVDISNPFPVPVEEKRRPSSVYEGIFSDVQTSDEGTECLAPMYSDMSDTDLPSMEESNSGSLSDQLHGAYSSSNLSFSDGNDLYFADSGDENQSYYDSLPRNNEIIMTDERYFNDNSTPGGLYIRSTSCPNVFIEQSNQPPMESDFSGSTEYSEDNTSEITETYSQSLESSDTASLSNLSQSVGGEHPEITDNEVEPERVSQNSGNNNKGQWSDLGKSAIAGLLEEMDELSGDSADEENGNNKSDANGNFHENVADSVESEVTIGDVPLAVDVVPESDYDADTDTLEKKREKVQSEKDSVTPFPSDPVNTDSTKTIEDDEATLTGDSSSEGDDVMTTVIRRDVKKTASDNGGLEAIQSPVVKRRGICDPKVRTDGALWFLKSVKLTGLSVYYCPLVAEISFALIVQYRFSAECIVSLI